MSDSTTQGQSANAGGGNDSARRRHPEHVCCVIHIAPCTAAANSDSARCWIDARIFYRAEVDDQAIIANPQSSRVMTAAADRNE